MSIEVLGISGSPTRNSNTDRLIKAILDETGAETEFVKLSTKNVRPCRACYQCVSDNVCKAEDDFPELAEKIKTAKALATEMKDYENMDLLGQVSVQGNIVCAFCGKGDDCEMSAFKSDIVDTNASDVKYGKVEDQKEAWDEAIGIGRVMAERLK